MAKKPNKLGTVTFTVSTNSEIAKYLLELVQTGAFGKNEAEAISLILRDRFLEHVQTMEQRDFQLKLSESEGAKRRR